MKKNADINQQRSPPKSLRLGGLACFAAIGTIVGWLLAANLIFQNPLFAGRRGMFLLAWFVSMLIGGLMGAWLATLIFRKSQ